MKKVFFIFSLFTLISCDRYFHEEEISIGLIENYEELVAATNGVYGKLAEAFNASFGYGFYNPNLKGDDLSNDPANYNSSWQNDSDICNPTQSISNGYYQLNSDNWKYLYPVIISANNILGQYESVMQEDSRTRNVLGEVYYLRAYCYFRLTRIYGQIPIILDIEINYQIPKSSIKDIYSFVEQDLITAMILLSDNNNTARIPYVTPHRGVAKALLAELYLNWAGYPLLDNSKYLLSAIIAGEIIDSAEYFGFGLLDDFAFLWDNEHLFNNESIFTLYFADPEYFGEANEINMVYKARTFSPDAIDSSDYAYIIGELSGMFYATERKFYDLYPDGYRKEITFFTRHKLNNSGIIHYDHSNDCIRIGYRKFYFDPEIVAFIQPFPHSYSYLGNSKVYLFRYSHTLLTYAEASARSGNLNEKSFDCVDRIRRRSRNLDIYTNSDVDLQTGLSTQDFVDSVLWERAWELAGEPEGRWFDLVRSQKVEELELYRYEDEGGVPEYPLTEEDYFSIIPPEDQILNPQLLN